VAAGGDEISWELSCSSVKTPEQPLQVAVVSAALDLVKNVETATARLEDTKR